MQIKDELNSINSSFVSIPKEEYNYLLRVVEEDTVCIDNLTEIELDIDDLKALIQRALNHLNK